MRNHSTPSPSREGMTSRQQELLFASIWIREREWARIWERQAYRFRQTFSGTFMDSGRVGMRMVEGAPAYRSGMGVRGQEHAR